MATSGKKVLFLVTNHDELGSSGTKVLGWYLPELCHPFDEFEKAGFKIDFASPAGGPAPVDKSSLTNFAKDSVCTRIWSRADIKESLEKTLRIKDVDIGTYDAIFVVGGHAPMWDYTNNAEACDKISKYYAEGGLVAAVCHGPCALVNCFVDGKPIVHDHEVTCFTNMEEDQVPGNLKDFLPFLLEDRLKERGARFVHAEAWGCCVAGKGSRLLTGQNPASAGPLAKQMIEQIGTRSSTKMVGTATALSTEHLQV